MGIKPGPLSSDARLLLLISTPKKAGTTSFDEVCSHKRQANKKINIMN